MSPVAVAPSKTKQIGVGRRAFQGFAAAAAVGLALLGVWRLESLWPKPADVRNAVPSIASRDTKSPADAIAGEMKAVLSGDSNGDGRVDGDDIQGFVSGRKDGNAKAESRDASAQAMIQALLGS